MEWTFLRLPRKPRMMSSHARRLSERDGPATGTRSSSMPDSFLNTGALTNPASSPPRRFARGSNPCKPGSKSCLNAPPLLISPGSPVHVRTCSIIVKRCGRSSTHLASNRPTTTLSVSCAPLFFGENDRLAPKATAVIDSRSAS